jgi:GT2 family glycosyltransferase
MTRGHQGYGSYYSSGMTSPVSKQPGPEQEHPLISVVIISWRMKSLLERMLQSLFLHCGGLDMEVFCVDNGSNDGTAEMVRDSFPQVRLILNDRNRGVAGARNQALPLARGKYVAILDADMEFVEDALGPIVEFLDHHPDVGIAGCRLTFSDGSTQLNAKRFPSPLALLSRRLPFLRAFGGGKELAHHEMASWDRKDSREVDYLIGACQVLRRELLDTVGLLDENIFYGPEDIDFCYRVHQAGWKIWWIHDTRIIHHEQRLTKRNPFSTISMAHYKALVYFFRKHGLGYASRPAPIGAPRIARDG